MYGVKDCHDKLGTAPEAPSCQVSQRVMLASITLLTFTLSWITALCALAHHWWILSSLSVSRGSPHASPNQKIPVTSGSGDWACPP